MKYFVSLVVAAVAWGDLVEIETYSNWNQFNRR